jgi:hypothetical protein
MFGVINEAGSKILYPRLVGNATGLHQVLILFVLIAGAEVGVSSAPCWPCPSRPWSVWRPSTPTGSGSKASSLWCQRPPCPLSRS